MSFPVQLSSSPVCEAFHGILLDPLEKLDLSDPEKALLRSAEDNPVEYTLAEQQDSEVYSHLLLKLIDQAAIASNNSKNNKSKNSELSRLSLDVKLPDDEALRIFYVDTFGVLCHYAVTKLTEVIQSLKQRPKSARATMETTFYPNGILLENWRPLLQILIRGGTDAFAQS